MKQSQSIAFFIRGQCVFDGIIEVNCIHISEIRSGKCRITIVIGARISNKYGKITDTVQCLMNKENYEQRNI